MVDTSGSMADPGRLDLVQEALRLLMLDLQPGDSVAIVAYNESARVALPHTPWDAQAELIGNYATRT